MRDRCPGVVHAVGVIWLVLLLCLPLSAPAGRSPRLAPRRPAPAGKPQPVWLMVPSGVIVVLVAGALRQSFGISLAPIPLDLDIARQVSGLVMAVQAPIFGVF